MNTITEKLAEALALTGRLIARTEAEHLATDASSTVGLGEYIRTTLAEYEATPRAYFPADYIREKLEKYDAEIADGTVSYAFYAGCFSQVARGMLERAA